MQISPVLQLRYIKQVCNYSNKTIAGRLGVSERVLYYWQKGQRNPSDKHRQHIKKWFDSVRSRYILLIAVLNTSAVYEGYTKYAPRFNNQTGDAIDHPAAPVIQTAIEDLERKGILMDYEVYKQGTKDRFKPKDFNGWLKFIEKHYQVFVNPAEFILEMLDHLPKKDRKACEDRAIELIEGLENE